MTQIKPIQRSSINTTKNHTHNNKFSNENTEELYNDLINKTDYYSVLGFLLSRMAYELVHEKQMSD